MALGSDIKMHPNDKFDIYYKNYEIEYTDLPEKPKFSLLLSAEAFILIRKISNDIGITKILTEILGRNKTINIIS